MFCILHNFNHFVFHYFNKMVYILWLKLFSHVLWCLSIKTQVIFHFNEALHLLYSIHRIIFSIICILDLQHIRSLLPVKHSQNKRILKYLSMRDNIEHVEL